MVDVLFGESEAESMKIEKTTQNLRDPDKVICLGFMMDVGDIKASADSQYRKDLIYSMYVQDQWGRDEELNKECQKLGSVYCNELNRLREFLEKASLSGSGTVTLHILSADSIICAAFCRIIKMRFLL